MVSETRPWERWWPAHVKGRFDVTESLPEMFRRVAEADPARVAVTFYGRDVNYGELNELSDRFAHALINLGLKKGERVGFLMQNCPQYIFTYFGALRAGGVVMPLNPMLKRTEIEGQLRDAQCRMLIVSESLYPQVEKARERATLDHVVTTSLSDFWSPSSTLETPPEVTTPKQTFDQTIDLLCLVEQAESSPVNRATDLHGDLALLQYTGGTTGLPKGAMIDHYVLAYSTMGSNNWFNHDERDVFLGVTPYFHVMGMTMGLCGPPLTGGRVVVVPRFVPEAVAKTIAEHRITGWVGTATMLVALLQVPAIESYDLSSLRYLCCGGAPFGLELQAQVRRLLPQAVLIEGYGLTEVCSHGGVITPLGGYHHGFVGTPHTNQVKIVDQVTGECELPPNEPGEIVIKGPVMFRGYWNRPEETAAMVRNGWIHTGDVALMDEDGYVQILGRTRDLIKCSGFSVFPADIEDLLSRHPAVGEVSVIGVADSYRGESPKAFVVLRPDWEGRVTEEEIVAWSRENMAAYKYPRLVEFRRELPKSGAGKVLRRVLVEEEARRA